MAKDMMNLFARREQDELAAAAASSSPILRDVHLRQARHYRRLAENVQEAIASAPPTRLAPEESASPR
jgi:hypothetical protein